MSPSANLRAFLETSCAMLHTPWVNFAKSHGRRSCGEVTSRRTVRKQTESQQTLNKFMQPSRCPMHAHVRGRYAIAQPCGQILVIANAITRLKPDFTAGPPLVARGWLCPVHSQSLGRSACLGCIRPCPWFAWHIEAVQLVHWPGSPHLRVSVASAALGVATVDLHPSSGAL